MLNKRSFLTQGASALLFGGGVSLLAACKGPAPPPARITDAAGRVVTISRTIGKVFAAGPPASVLVYALAPEKMVGWVRAPSPQQKEFLAAPYRDLPEHGRLTGKGNTANLEQVIALKPDLIVDVGSLDPTFASLADRVQEQTGIAYVLLDGAFAKSAELIRSFGEMIGANARAEKLAGYGEATLAAIKQRLSTTPVRPSVYYGRGPEGLETGLKGSINLEVLEAVGATNVAGAAGGGGLTNISPEQLLKWNPDVILAQDKKFRDALLADKAWKSLKAVREGQVFVPPSAPFGWFDAPPGINRLLGARWLLVTLYPRPGDDLAATTAEFYDLFYHVKLAPEQIDRLLAPARAAR